MPHAEKPLTPVTVRETIRHAENAGFPYLMQVGGMVIFRGGGNVPDVPRTADFTTDRIFPRLMLRYDSGSLLATINTRAQSDDLMVVGLGLTRVRGVRGEELPDQLYFGVLGYNNGFAETRISIRTSVDSVPVKSFDIHGPLSEWDFANLEGDPTRKALEYSIKRMGMPERWLANLESRKAFDGAAEDLKELVRTSALSLLEER